MKKIIVLQATIFILFCGIASSFGQTVSEEAKRHFDRGMAAVEMAKSPADYAPAIKEFEQAGRLAPSWPDVYYNLGMVQEKAGKYSDAVTNLKQYLRLAPNASDAETVKILINKLEYKKDQEEGVKRVFAMMNSGLYEKDMVECSQTGGDKWIFHGPFGIYNSLDEFRSVEGKMEVRNIAYVYDKKYGGLYHPELRPPHVEWAPVKIKNNFYEYNYIYYCDVATGHVAEYFNEIKGEIISINPPRVREVIKTTSKRGIRIPGETARFIGGEGSAECIFEWELK